MEAPANIGASGQPVVEVHPRPATLPVGEPTGWRGSFWDYREHVALRFASSEDLDALIDRFWSDPALWGLPRVYVGDNTVVVPAGAADYLRQQGHEFTLTKVVSAGDLPAEEVNRIRRGLAE
jgi:hypothetical protein